MAGTIRVHTAQNVTLEYKVASISDRIVATLIDWAILFAYGMAWVGIFSWVGSDGSGTGHTSRDWHDPSSILVVLILCLIATPFLFYNLACEVFMNGQSLGKKARNLRVVRLDGTAPRLGDYLLRWLLRVVDIQFYGLVAMVTIAATGKGQRLGDLAAGTSVINQKPLPSSLPDFASLVPPVGYQPVFPQAATLSDHDVTLLHQLLDRAQRNSNSELLHETALKIKGLLGLHTDLDDAAFLRTVLRDHLYLQGSVDVR